MKELVNQADDGKKKGKGSAYIFLRGTERHPRYVLPPSCAAFLMSAVLAKREAFTEACSNTAEGDTGWIAKVAFEWGDLDEEPL